MFLRSHNLGEDSDQVNSQEQMYIKQHIINLKFKQNKHGRAATGNFLGCNRETVDCRDDTVLLLLYGLFSEDTTDGSALQLEEHTFPRAVLGFLVSTATCILFLTLGRLL